MNKTYKQYQDVNKQLIYEGKAKKVFKGETAHTFLLEFKDSLTAFNAAKKGQFENKGALNRDIASLLFKKLSQKGVRSHWISDVGLTGMLVHEVRIIPLEVVVRNRLAGSTAKKLGIEEGKSLENPLVEFYYKNDSLSDPFVSDDQVLMLGVATQEDLVKLKELALIINRALLGIFLEVGIDLIDFKLEFGKDKQGEILLADEITPDCCRLWDKITREKLDKDRFRRDLGGVKESYEEVYHRLKGGEK